MSDSYQAIYDAVRSKISNCDTSSIVERVVYEVFDISFQKQHLQQEIYAVSHEMQRPSVLLRPVISRDGNMWCALYGENLIEGIAGFGETPDAAFRDFDARWVTEKTTLFSPLPAPPKEQEQ